MKGLGELEGALLDGACEARCLPHCEQRKYAVKTFEEAATTSVDTAKTEAEWKRAFHSPQRAAFAIILASPVYSLFQAGN